MNIVGLKTLAHLYGFAHLEPHWEREFRLRNYDKKPMSNREKKLEAKNSKRRLRLANGIPRHNSTDTSTGNM